MRKSLLSSSISALLVLAALFIPASMVRADAAPQRLQALTVSFWPEYDQPETLVIMHGQLPASAGLPAHLAFRLPARVAAPSSTAAIDDSGQFRYIRPQIGQESEATVVAYDTPAARFQLEYYDNNLAKDGATHSLDLVYRADYAVDQLTLEFKEPFGASAVTLDPAGATPVQGDDGLNVHSYTVGAVTAGQEIHWKVSYTRADARLSAVALGLPTPAAATYEGSRAAAPSNAPSWVAWAIVALVSLLALGLAVGLILVIRAQRRSGYAASSQDGANAGRSTAHKGASGPVKVARGKFCHKCGASLGKDDVFCRQCGTRRRGA